MAINVPFGGVLAFNMRNWLGSNLTTAGTPYNINGMKFNIGRPASFNARWTAGALNLTFDSLTTSTLTAFDVTTLTVGSPAGRTPAFAGTPANGRAFAGGWGPDFCTFGINIAQDGFNGGHRLSIFSGSYGPGQSAIARAYLLQNIDIAPIYMPLTAGGSETFGGLNIFVGNLGRAVVSTVGFFTNECVENKFGGRSVSLGFVPHLNGGDGKISFVVRDSADPMLSPTGVGYGWGWGSVSIPENNGGIIYAMRAPNTYATGVDWRLWSASRINLLATAGNNLGAPWQDYNIFEQTFIQGDTFTCLNASSYTTYMQTSVNATVGAKVQSTPWGFLVYFMGNSTDQNMSSFLLIKRDLSAYYECRLMYQGSYASPYVMSGQGTDYLSRAINIDNNGVIYYYHVNNPSRVLIATDLMAKLGLEINLPALPPFSMPCVTPCMGIDGVITKT